jgi:hypothetical protein
LDPSGDLSIGRASFDGRNIALAVKIVAAGHRGTVASQQNRVIPTSGHLGVGDAFFEGRDITLAVVIIAASRRGAIAPKQYGVGTCNGRHDY